MLRLFDCNIMINKSDNLYHSSVSHNDEVFNVTKGRKSSTENVKNKKCLN